MRTAPTTMRISPAILEAQAFGVFLATRDACVNSIRSIAMAIDSRFAGPTPLGHFGASLAPSCPRPSSDQRVHHRDLSEFQTGPDRITPELPYPGPLRCGHDPRIPNRNPEVAAKFESRGHECSILRNDPPLEIALDQLGEDLTLQGGGPAQGAPELLADLHTDDRQHGQLPQFAHEAIGDRVILRRTFVMGIYKDRGVDKDTQSLLLRPSW